jgi:hypothetical protein
MAKAKKSGGSKSKGKAWTHSKPVSMPKGAGASIAKTIKH